MFKLTSTLSSILAYFDRNFQTLHEISFKQLVYVDLPLLVPLSTVRITGEYSKLRPRAHCLFLILQVTKQTFMVDENVIPNAISIDRPTPLTMSICHSRILKESRILSKDETTIVRRSTTLRRQKLSHCVGNPARKLELLHYDIQTSYKRRDYQPRPAMDRRPH